MRTRRWCETAFGHALLSGSLLASVGCATVPKESYCGTETPRFAGETAVLYFTFGADDDCCEPDTELRATLARVAPDYPDVTVHAVNVTEEETLVAACGVVGIPTLLRFERGVRRGELAGKGDEARVRALFAGTGAP